MHGSSFEHIPSCKPGLGEVITGLPPESTCIEVDATVPRSAAGIRAPVHASPVRARSVLQGRPDRSEHGRRPRAEGMPGLVRTERAASVQHPGHQPDCAAGLSVLADDFGVCGRAPVDWAESNAHEAPRGPARTVFFFHGNPETTTPPMTPRPTTSFTGSTTGRRTSSRFAPASTGTTRATRPGN